jgi:cell division transport system ATP-binding protein
VVVKPKILLADEPTGNLDAELGRRLMRVFQQFNRHGTTIVFATHNREILANTPHANILYLRDGAPVVPGGDPRRDPLGEQTRSCHGEG